jgi:small nuclear ribonucleoprotein (snRNP)-like protein
MMSKTAQEKAMVKVQAQKVLGQIKNVDKIANVIVEKISEYKAQGHVSKKGATLVGLPARNIGINKWLIETYKCEPDVAFKVVELIAEKSGKFKVGFAPFGSLLYLPEDYRGSNAGIDFADLLK